MTDLIIRLMTSWHLIELSDPSGRRTSSSPSSWDDSKAKKNIIKTCKKSNVHHKLIIESLVFLHLDLWKFPNTSPFTSHRRSSKSWSLTTPELKHIPFKVSARLSSVLSAVIPNVNCFFFTSSFTTWYCFILLFVLMGLGLVLRLHMLKRLKFILNACNETSTLSCVCPQWPWTNDIKWPCLVLFSLFRKLNQSHP